MSLLANIPRRRPEMVYNVENFVTDLRGLQNCRPGLSRVAEPSPENEARPESGCENM